MTCRNIRHKLLIFSETERTMRRSFQSWRNIQQFDSNSALPINAKLIYPKRHSNCSLSHWHVQFNIFTVFCFLEPQTRQLISISWVNGMKQEPKIISPKPHTGCIFFVKVFIHLDANARLSNGACIRESVMRSYDNRNQYSAHRLTERKCLKRPCRFSFTKIDLRVINLVKEPK